ncbi:hypothetical protein [Pedobacter nutrimenti]|nr:hypothetical protein [Pedobacter nutrimenti]
MKHQKKDQLKVLYIALPAAAGTKYGSTVGYPLYCGAPGGRKLEQI